LLLLTILCCCSLSFASARHPSPLLTILRCLPSLPSLTTSHYYPLSFGIFAAFVAYLLSFAATRNPSSPLFILHCFSLSFTTTNHSSLLLAILYPPSLPTFTAFATSLYPSLLVLAILRHYSPSFATSRSLSPLLISLLRCSPHFASARCPPPLLTIIRRCSLHLAACHPCHLPPITATCCRSLPSLCSLLLALLGSLGTFKRMLHGTQIFRVLLAGRQGLGIDRAMELMSSPPEIDVNSIYLKRHGNVTALR